MIRFLAIGIALFLAATWARSAEPDQLLNLRQAIKRAELAYESARKAAEADFTIWLDKAPEGPTEPTPEGEGAHFSFESLEDGRFPNAIRSGPSAILKGRPSLGTGKVGTCFVFDGSNGLCIPKIPSFYRSDAFTLGCWLRADGNPTNATLIHTAKDALSRGFSLRFAEGKIVVSLVHKLPDNALLVASRNPFPSDQWSHLAVTYDGSSKAAGLRVYLNGRPMPTDVRNDDLTRDIASERSELSVGASHENGLRGIAIDEFRVFHRDLTQLEIAALAGREDYREAVQLIPEPSAEQRSALFEYFIAASNDATKETLNALRSARKAESEYLESASNAERPCLE